MPTPPLTATPAGSIFTILARSIKPLSGGRALLKYTVLAFILPGEHLYSYHI